MFARLNSNYNYIYPKGTQLEIFGVHISSKYGSGVGFQISVNGEVKYIDSAWFEPSSIVGSIKVENNGVNISVEMKK